MISLPNKGTNAKYWLLIAGLLTFGMVYLGNSNHRLADTNDALSTDLQLLIEYIDMPRQDIPTGPQYSMPILQ